jgi:hypothetical protein
MVQSAEFHDEQEGGGGGLPCNDENHRPLHPNQLPEPNGVVAMEDENLGPNAALVAANNGLEAAGGSSNADDDPGPEQASPPPASSSLASPSSRPNFYVGMFLDVLDTVDKWSEAEVLEVDHVMHRVFITYTYWMDKFNEWIPFDSARIAPFMSHTFSGDPRTLKVSPTHAPFPSASSE